MTCRAHVRRSRRCPARSRDAAGPEGCAVAFGTLYAIADLMGAL